MRILSRCLTHIIAGWTLGFILATAGAAIVATVLGVRFGPTVIWPIFLTASSGACLGILAWLLKQKDVPEASQEDAAKPAQHAQLRVVA